MAKRPIAHAATLIPLAIGLGMNAATSRTNAQHETAAQPQTVACRQFGINPEASSALAKTALPSAPSCKVRTASDGFFLPDPTCTPGAINPTVTTEVLQDPNFRTVCVRGQATSEEQKHETYSWYGIASPTNNAGSTQTCELDHLISLELGGADTLDNIWPQCGPPDVALSERYFKRKDGVENYLARQVREGKMSLDEAQRGIAADWTQYLAASESCDSAVCE